MNRKFMSHRGTEKYQFPGLEYLKGLSKVEAIEREFSLSPLREVLERLGDPQRSLRFVHVAGTNGKGSTAVAVASILAQRGLRVGLTISPHLSRLNERIIVDGGACSDEALSEAALQIQQACSDSEQDLSFFEAMIGCAFLIFKQERVDWGILETGLGGRLDATNVVTNTELAIITTIAFDHEHLLGSTLESIAREKVGIIKQGCKVVIGLLPQDGRREVMQVAQKLECPVLEAGKHFKWEVSGNGKRVFFEANDGFSVFFMPSLRGNHQAHNFSLAIQGANLLGASADECKRGVETLFWPARLERIEGYAREIYLDSAHNVAGVEQLVSFIEQSGLGTVDLAFAALQTKRWREMIQLLLPRVNEWSLLTADSERAVESSELGAYLSCLGVKYNIYGHDYALFMKSTLTQKPLPLLIAGSMYMVGRIRDLLMIPERPLWKI